MYTTKGKTIQVMALRLKSQKLKRNQLKGGTKNLGAVCILYNNRVVQIEFSFRPVAGY